MKVLIALALSTALLAAAAAADESREVPQFFQEFFQVAIKCAELLGKTEDDVKELLDTQQLHEHLIETTDFPKNLLICILRSYKVFDSDYKLNTEALVTLIEKLFGKKMPKEVKAKTAEIIIDKCGSKGDSDEPPAERAKNMFNCVSDNDQAISEAMHPK